MQQQDPLLKDSLAGGALADNRDQPSAAAHVTLKARTRRGRPGWEQSVWLTTLPLPLLFALLFALAIALLDAIIPGLPRRGGSPVGAWMAFMSGICPQRPAHSYTLGGVQLPIEARMVGMFGAFFFGVLELATVGRRRSLHWPPRLVALALLVGFTAMAFDGVNALFYDLRALGLPHLYTPDLRLRLATGVAAGLAMAFALTPAVGQVIVPVSPSAAPCPGWRDVGLAAACAAGYALLVASGWAPLLYPTALIAVAGVVLAFMLISLAIIGAAQSAKLGFHLVGDGALWWMSALAGAGALVALIALAALRRFVPVPV